MSEPSILLFDGVCNLCNASVQFVINHDHAKRFCFASLQSEVGRALLAKHGLPPDALETVVLIEGERAWTRSDAALGTLVTLGGVWRLFGVFRLVPRPLRDVCYRWIAANRYRWFGRTDVCMVPTPELKARFLA